MNVRRGGFAGNGARERIVGDLAGLQVAAQPDTLGSIWTHRHIDAAAMIKTQRAVQMRLALRR